MRSAFTFWSLCSTMWANDHNHVSTVLTWPGFNLAKFCNIFSKVFQEMHTEFRTLLFTAAELDHCFDFVTSLQELLCLSYFGLVVVVFNLQAEANFLQLCSCLVSAGLTGLNGGLVPVFTEVHQFCNGWFGFWCYFHQVSFRFNGQPQRILAAYASH